MGGWEAGSEEGWEGTTHLLRTAFRLPFGGRATISALLVNGCLSEDRKFLIASASGTSEGGD